MKLAWIGRAALGLAVALTAAIESRAQDEQDIPFSACPAAVKKTMLDETKNAKVDTVTKETEDGKTTYWATLDLGGKMYGIGVQEDGTLEELSLEIDTDETHVAACPAAVQKTFQEEAKGAKFDVVNKDLKFGVTVYQAVVVIGGKEYEIVAAEDGTLVEKTLLIEEEEIELSSCPAAVQKTFKAEARGGDVGEVTRASGIMGHVYEANVKAGGKTYTISVAKSGMLISKSLDEDE